MKTLEQKKNRRKRFIAAIALWMAAAAWAGAAGADELLEDSLEDLPEDAALVLDEAAQEEDFASSWDDVLYAGNEDEVLEGWQEEQYVQDLAQEQPEQDLSAVEAAGAADEIVVGDVLTDGVQDGFDASEIMDGMEGGPTQDELSAAVLARAYAFLDAPYSVLAPADPEHIRQLLTDLTKMPSPTGSDGELTIGQYIMDTMEGLGYHVTYQNFHEDFLNEDLVDVPGMNILAEREVNDPNPTDEVLLVITHYDSKTDPEEDDPFANDKTGVAAALEAARLVAQESTVTDICFVFLSGEEDGLYGSRSFVNSIKVYADKIIGVINVGTNGYVQTLTVPVDETHSQEVRTTFQTELGTPEGEDNAPAKVLLTSATVQKLSVLSGLDEEEEEDQDNASRESETITNGNLDWKITQDPESSCMAFYEEGMQTVWLHQQLSGISKAGLDSDNVRIEADEQTIAENADVLARAVGMYMAGIR